MAPALLALLAAFGVLHVANGVVHRFEREAAADLAGRINGPQKKVTIRSEIGPEAIFGDIQRVEISASDFQADRFPLFVEPRRSHAGQLRALAFRLRNFDLGSLHVERLDAEVPDCRFDLTAAIAHHIFRLSESGSGEVESDVSQDDLAAFVRKKVPGLQNLRVTIDRDKLLLEGHGVFLMLPADFWIAARLEPVEGTRLVLTHPRLILNGRVIDPANAKGMIGLFNPVLDLNRDLGLANAVHIDRVQLQNGQMTTQGHLKIPAE